MNYIKLFEEFEDTILVLRFNDTEEYLKAVEYFNSKSPFSPSDTNYEFKSISFYCSDQDDADITENDITDELNTQGFDNYYFE